MIKPAIIYCFLGQMIWLHGGVLKRGVIKKTEKTFWERECGRMLRMGEGCEDNCVPCNSQQQMISEEADFSNHADRVPVTVGCSQYLFPDIPAIHQWVYDQSGQVTHGLNNTGFHSPRLIYLGLPLSARPATNRDKNMTPCLGGPASNLRQVD